MMIERIKFMQSSLRGLNILQKISMSLMGVLVLLTFIGANVHALFWQSSDWLVSTVLPAVVVDLTNDERADNAVLPLVRNSILDEAARLKAEHMAKHEYFSHFSPEGVTPWHWFSEAGYVYAHAGENLAIHFTDSTEVVEAWMKSPAHRKNIVNSLYTEIGVGTAKGKYEGYDTVYVVQLFGSPAVAPPKPEPEPIFPASPPIVEEVAVIEPEAAPVATPEPIETEVLAELPTEETVLSEEIKEISEPQPLPLATTEIPIEEAETAFEPTGDELLAAKDVVVIERTMISTSSGLAVANLTKPHIAHAGGTMASIVTKPNALLQVSYMVLGTIVFLLLILSIILEARRFHMVQVAYGLVLLVGMGGLWFVHSLMTAGAVIV
jgi:hypothetical protein